MNILIIICDQLSAKAVGAYGNQWAQTPNIDTLVQGGVRFEKAYTPCTICQPARCSLWTSLYPHESGIETNQFGIRVTEDIITLGQVFSDAGYECIHIGKQHDAGSLSGFYCHPETESVIRGKHEEYPLVNGYCDYYVTDQAEKFLNKKHDTPFLFVADYQNPHDICNWIGSHAGHFLDMGEDCGDLPPLPDNFETDDFYTRPLPVKYICCTHRRMSQASQWTKSEYRHYLKAYFHYVKTVDQEIGKVLKALDSGPNKENTLTVFTVDHGEGMAAHRLVTKQVNFYEEVVRIPLIMRGPNIEKLRELSSSLPVSLIDIFPTLCDYAKISKPENISGKSFFTSVKSNNSKYVVSEWHSMKNKLVSPGRMLSDGRFKYIYYLEDNGEEFYDLNKDPGEKHNLAVLKKPPDKLETFRETLKKHCIETKDNFFETEVKINPLFRNSHPENYRNHK